MKNPHHSRREKNPFRIFFISIVVVCCLALSIVFYYVRYVNNRETQQRYASLLVQDFETQLSQIKGIAFQIASNYKFHPYYFEESIVRELDMLNAFSQYRYYSSLTQDYFIYYGKDRMYCSSGKTMDYTLFLKEKASSEDSRTQLASQIASVRENWASLWGGVTVFSTGENLYVLVPIRVQVGTQMDTAVVGAIIAKTDLGDRFSMLLGSIRSDFTLYSGESILYASQTSRTPTKRAVYADSENGQYRLFYQAKELPEENRYVFLQYFLILTDLLLLFVIANIFATRAYKPIKVLARKYKDADPEDDCSNSLEQLSTILSQMSVHKATAEAEIQRKQKLLQEQVLKMLLENVNVHEISMYLNHESIHLDGPFFCVVSMSFGDAFSIANPFLELLRVNLEEISYGENYIYTIWDDRKKLLHALCSFCSEEDGPDLLETIFAVAEGYDQIPIIGVGSVYQSLNHISASYLESVDSLYSQKVGSEEQNEMYAYLLREIHGIAGAMEFGNEDAALDKLKDLLQQLRQKNASSLVLRYAIANFCTEMKRLSQKYQIQLSSQNMALLISAKNMDSLESSFTKVIHDFMQNCEQNKKQKLSETPRKICQFIEAHFMEYDLSIEKVADSLHVTTTMVRQAVQEVTSEGYKEHIISLRIAYAKELLAQTDLSVSAVCEKVGYGNISHFINLFKKVTGLTPAKYRRDVLDNSL